MSISGMKRQPRETEWYRRNIEVQKPERNGSGGTAAAGRQGGERLTISGGA